MDLTGAGTFAGRQHSGHQKASNILVPAAVASALMHTGRMKEPEEFIVVSQDMERLLAQGIAGLLKV